MVADGPRGFRPVAAAGWAAHDGVFGAGDLVGHGDFGPWNLVWHGNRPVGILDWDYVLPAPPVFDVAYALEYVTPFRDDDFAMRHLRHPGPPDRRRRLELFASAYGLTSTDDLAAEVYAQQREVLGRARRLAAEGHQPQLSWHESGALDDVERRIGWTFDV